MSKTYLYTPAQMAAIAAAINSSNQTAYDLAAADASGQPGADPESIIWLIGAGEVNANDGGAFSNFIRSYTDAQLQQRGLTRSASDQNISDQIAKKVLGVIDGTDSNLSPAGQGYLPSIDEIADADAAPAAEELFGGNYGAWAGCPLFVALGDTDYFNQYIVGDPTNTYNAIAMFAAIANGPGFWGTLDAGLASLWTNGWSATRNTENYITSQISSYLQQAYGSVATTMGLTGTALGTWDKEFVGTQNQGMEYAADGDAPVSIAVFGSGDDVIDATQSGNTLYDGGGGSNSINYGSMANIIVTIGSNDPSNPVDSAVPFVGSVDKNPTGTTWTDSANTDYLFNIQTLNVSDTAVVILDNISTSLQISAEGSQSTGATLDLSGLRQAVTFDNTASKIGNINFSGFASLIGTHSNDVFTISDSQADGAAANPIARYDGGGGSDTFDVNYKSGGGSSLLLQNSGGSQYRFDNAQNAAFTVVWGGASGGNTFDFETDGAAAAAAKVNVCEVQMSNIDESSFANLDLSALESYVEANYGVSGSTIVIVDPTSSDTLELDGKAVSGLSYGVTSVDNRFYNYAGTATGGSPTLGTIDAAGDSADGIPGLAKFQAQPGFGEVDTQWYDRAQADEGFGWTSSAFNVQTSIGAYGSSNQLQNVEIGENDGNTTTAVTSVDSTNPRGVSTALTQGSGFDPQIDVQPSSHTGDIFSTVPVTTTYNDGVTETQGGLLTGTAAISEVQQEPLNTAFLNLVGFDNNDFGLDLDESDLTAGMSTDTATQYDVTQWDQWDYWDYDTATPRIYGRIDELYGTLPDLTSAQIASQSATTSNGEALPTVTAANYRALLNIQNFQLAPVGGSGGGGGSGGNGGSGGSGGGSGGSGGGTAPVVSVAGLEADQSQLDATAGGFSVQDTAAAVAQGFDILNADSALTVVSVTDAATAPLVLTAAEATGDQTALGKLDTTGLTVEVADSAAALGALSAQQIAALPTAGIKTVALQSGSLSLSVAQATAFAAATEALTAATGASVALSDTAANLASVTPAAIAGLPGLGVTSIAVQSGDLAVTVAQALALEAAGLAFAAASGASVTLSDTATNIATLTAAQVAALPAAGIGYTPPPPTYSWTATAGGLVVPTLPSGASVTLTALDRNNVTFIEQDANLLVLDPATNTVLTLSGVYGSASPQGSLVFADGSQESVAAAAAAAGATGNFTNGVVSNNGLAQYTGYLVNAPPAPERNAVSFLELTGSGCATAIFTTNPAGTLEDFDSSNGVQRTYLYSAADGNAIVSDEGGDSAVILTDVASTDVKLWLVADGSGEDVAIEIEATSQILTLVGAGNPSGNNDFSGITFADGVTLSEAQLATAATTYHWSATAGGLTLPALQWRQTVLFVGLDPGKVSFIQQDANLLVLDAATGTVLTLTDVYGAGGVLGSFVFADGSSETIAQAAAGAGAEGNFTSGIVSNNGLTGPYTGYLVNAPASSGLNDGSFLELAGSNCSTALFTANTTGSIEDFDSSNGYQRTYIYSAADGNAIISDEGGHSSVILTDIASTGVTLQTVQGRDGYDIAITVQATGSVLTLVDAGDPGSNTDFSGVRFSDGVTLTQAQLATAGSAYTWTPTTGGLVLPVPQTMQTLSLGLDPNDVSFIQQDENLLVLDAATDTVLTLTGVFAQGGVEGSFLFANGSRESVATAAAGAGAQGNFTSGVVSNNGLARYTGFLVNAPAASGLNAGSYLELTGSNCPTALFTANATGSVEDFDSSNGSQRTYLYSAADGNATVSDEGGNSAVILTDIASTGVTLQTVADGSGDDIAITVKATGSVLTLVAAGNPSSNNDFSGVNFADSVTLSEAQLAATAAPVATAPSGGAPTYSWSATAGGLVVPVLQSGQSVGLTGLDKASVSFVEQDGNLLVLDPATNTVLTLSGVYGAAGPQGTLVFADGSQESVAAAAAAAGATGNFTNGAVSNTGLGGQYTGFLVNAPAASGLNAGSSLELAGSGCSTALFTANSTGSVEAFDSANGYQRTYLYSKADGTGTISDSGGQSAVILTDIASTDVTEETWVNAGSTASLADIVLKINDTGSTLTLYGAAAQNGDFSGVAFADGVTLTEAQLAANAWLVAGTGDVTLTAGAGNTTLVAGLGDDTMVGGAGNDTFVYQSQDGTLTIDDQAAAGQPARTNTLQLGDLKAADLTFSQSASDLVIAIAATGKTITVASEFAPGGSNGIAAISFADGTQWLQSDIQQHLQHAA